MVVISIALIIPYSREHIPVKAHLMTKKKPKRAQSAQGHPRLSLPRRHDNWYIRDYLPLANCHFRVFLAEFNLHFRDLAWYKMFHPRYMAIFT